MTRLRTAAVALTGGLALAVAAAGTAAAVDYPPPANPGAVQPKPKGPFKTLKVCKKGCAYKTIQSAVNKAKAGDTVKVKAGTYKEAVTIFGPKKRYLKLVGDPKNPRKVLIDATGKQNAVFIREANRVEVNGISAKGYSGNGFFVLNNDDGYKLTNLVAQGVGVYGLYAFNSRGGEMSNSEAYYHNDSGFYVGQTPPQKKPKRTFVKNVKSWGNALGFSGTNMRYVTITKSRWYNNSAGIVPNALDSEKYAPPEDNEIVDNEIFLNNFNVYKGAPFKVRTLGGVSFPPGMGLLLFGGRNTKVENNRVYGNFLVGIAGFQQVLLKDPATQVLKGTVVRNNTFGNGGQNLNGRDLFYDGDGENNCFDPAGTQNNLPADNGTLKPCPFSGANTLNEAAQGQAFGWALGIDVKNPDTAEAGYVRNPQAAVPGVNPLEVWTKGYKP